MLEKHLKQMARFFDVLGISVFVSLNAAIWPSIKMSSGTKLQPIEFTFGVQSAFS